MPGQEREPRSDFSFDSEGSSWAPESKWDDRRVPLRDKLTQAIKGARRDRTKR